MAELDIRKVDKIYHSRKGDVHAVKALDLVVKPGEIVALLGSSGCGKTSTLRMIAGFEEVSNGAITLGGKAIHTLPPAQRGVAMAFEAYSLYPPLTIGENMSFALKASKLPQAEQQRRVTAMAEMLEIADMYQREVEYELKNLSAQIEPILIVALGIMVLILALGVFLPMWDLGKAAIK